MDHASILDSDEFTTSEGACSNYHGGGVLFADGVTFSFGAEAMPFVKELCKRQRHQDPLDSTVVLAAANEQDEDGRIRFENLLGQLLALGVVRIRRSQRD